MECQKIDRTLVVLALVAGITAPLRAAGCNFAQKHAQLASDYAGKAAEVQDIDALRQAAGMARDESNSAATEASNCGCTDASSPLEEVNTMADKAANAFSVEEGQADAGSAKTSADAALSAISGCSKQASDNAAPDASQNPDAAQNSEAPAGDIVNTLSNSDATQNSDANQNSDESPTPGGDATQHPGMANQ